MKRLLSILFSVIERMVILDSCVNDILSYIVKTNHGPCLQELAMFFKVRMFLHHVESETDVQSCQK